MQLVKMSLAAVLCALAINDLIGKSRLKTEYSHSIIVQNSVKRSAGLFF